jgi:SAM-dependent methyltransferase
MYPLSFPLRVLARAKAPTEWVLDPFCGRGTTNFAARILGLPSIGIDTSQIAVAIARAKLVSAEPEEVINAAEQLIAESSEPDIPDSEFWTLAFHGTTLRSLVQLRAGLLKIEDDPIYILLRAIVLGALHGPLTKGIPSYFSNQCPRTFAPKPGYAVRFWKRRNLKPPRVDLLSVIQTRANRYLCNLPVRTTGAIILDDSRNVQTYGLGRKFSYVVTSPPYYGMRTYIPDQWLRNWFLGGPDQVTYLHPAGSLCHKSLDAFIADLKRLWMSVADVCMPGAKLCRFGAIRDRDHDPIAIIKRSLSGTDWQLLTVKNAGNSLAGKRQAIQFGDRVHPLPRHEYDFYARLSL